MDYLSEIRLPLDKIPEAKDWKVGSKHKLNALVEITGINKERDYGDYDEPVSIGKSRDRKPRFHTMVKFKVTDVSSAKTKALAGRT